MIINPRWVDIDLTAPIGVSGVIESAEDATFGAAWPDRLQVFRRNEWADEKRRQFENLGTYTPGRLYLEPWNNQTPESSCVYNSAEGGWRYLWNRQLGPAFGMKCSPMSGYINQTTRRHTGSTMWGAMEWMTEVGLLPEKSSRYTDAAGLLACHGRSVALCRHTFHQNTPFVQRSALPDGWRSTAKHFRVLEWIRIDTVEQFASALLHRLPIIYGRQRHCILGSDLVQDDRGRWLVEYLDSYGPGRGDNGRLYDTEANWSTGGAWAAASVVVPDNPLRPAGDDGKPATRPVLRSLYPDVSDEYFEALATALAL